MQVCIHLFAISIFPSRTIVPCHTQNLNKFFLRTFSHILCLFLFVCFFGLCFIIRILVFFYDSCSWMFFYIQIHFENIIILKNDKIAEISKKFWNWNCNKRQRIKLCFFFALKFVLNWKESRYSRGDDHKKYAFFLAAHNDSENWKEFSLLNFGLFNTNCRNNKFKMLGNYLPL